MLNRGIIIAIVIVAILVLAYFYMNMAKSTGTTVGVWVREPGTGYVGGSSPDAVLAAADGPGGNAKYLGTFQTVGACESACGANPACTAYTWLDNTAAQYANMCYGLGKINVRETYPTGHFSGYRKEGFCPKLLQKYGMCSAGK